MSVSTVFRDVVIPLLSLGTMFGCAAMTVFLFLYGSIGGGLSILALTVVCSLFVWHDAKRLFINKV